MPCFSWEPQAGHAAPLASTEHAKAYAPKFRSQVSLHTHAGLPPNTELKPQAEAALARLKQDVASKAAAARASEQRTSATQALHKAAVGQLDSMQRELTGLQEDISQGMKSIYNQVGLP